MNIRKCPEYIPFLEAIITFIELFPRDMVLYGIMMNALEIPDSLQLHIKVTNGENTRPAWIKIFQWSIDTYSFQGVKERMHDAMQNAGAIIHYRSFIREYGIEILRPEPELEPQAESENKRNCFSFFCSRK